MRKAKGTSWKTNNLYAAKLAAERSFDYIGARLTMVRKVADEYLKIKYSDLESSLISENGYSHWFYQPKTSGFVVGNGEQGLILKLVHEPFELNNLIKKRIEYVIDEYLADGFDGIGFWIEDNLLYIDPIMHFEDETEAREAGKLFKEKAIYNLSTGMTTYL